MRVNMTDAATPGIIVRLDGEGVRGCIEADDVEGWVKRCRMVPGTEKDPIPRYLQSKDGPLTEIVEGRVQFLMLKYKYDGEGKKIIGHEEVPMDWELYLEERRNSIKMIHAKDTVKLRNVLALLDEWYGKAKTQDAEARQRKQEAEASSQGQEEDEGPEVEADGGAEDDPISAPAPRRSSPKGKTIGKSR